MRPKGTKDDLVAGFPREIEFDTNSGRTRYALAQGVYAVHGGKVGGEPLLRLESEGIEVHEGTPPTEVPHGTVITPAYRLGPQGPLAVPTGAVFVRLEEGHRLEALQERLADVGFTLTQVLPYAPHAGWARASSGRVQDTLEKFTVLLGLESVAAVEPQLLTERRKR